MKTPILNVDYILTIIQNEDKVELKKHDIIHKYTDLITSLDELVDDESCTISQMEKKLFSLIPYTTGSYMYFYPFEYDSSYVERVSLPSRITPQKYNEEINKCKSEEEKRQYIKRLKLNFVSEAYRYIMALEYWRTMNELTKRRDVKMYSMEIIGHFKFDFNINEDVKAVVRTNFGYGSASSFTLKLTYKGIDIIPYSHIVEYYYAKAVDIIRCTESYEPVRKNWEEVMSLVVNASNEAKISSNNFITKFIIDECRKMISELRNLSNNYWNFHYQLAMNRHSDLRIRYVNDFDNRRRDLYKIYPDEVAFTFKCEKISGALHFLDNLLNQAEYIPEIGQYIDELKSMNINLIPQIDYRNSTLKTEIRFKESEKYILENQKSAAEMQMEPHNENIKNILEERKKEKEDKGEIYNEYLLKRQVEEEYYNNHEYVNSLKENIDDLTKKITELSKDIDMRSNFKKMLDDCKALIEEKVNSSVA